MNWTISDELNVLLSKISDVVLRDKIIAFVTQEGDRARNEGYDEGYDDGYDEGYLEGETYR